MLLWNKRTVRGTDRLWSLVNTLKSRRLCWFRRLDLGHFPQDSLLPAQFVPFLEAHPLDILFYTLVFIKPLTSPRGPLREMYFHFFSVSHLFSHKWYRVTLKTNSVSRLIPDSKHRRRKKNNNRLIIFFAPYMAVYLSRNSESWEVKQRLQLSQFQTAAGQSQPSEP